MGDLFCVNQKSKMASTTRHIWQKTILLKNKKVSLIWKTFKSFGRKISWIVPWIAFYQMFFFFSSIRNSKFKIELWKNFFLFLPILETLMSSGATYIVIVWSFVFFLDIRVGVHHRTLFSWKNMNWKLALKLQTCLNPNSKYDQVSL